MRFKEALSPNFSKKLRKKKDIKFIILHYTGMQSKRASIKRLLSKRHKVSCHYLIDRLGIITKMVDDNRVAWHAGKSKWKNFINLNQYSIGIELVNKGHRFGYEKFTKNQLNSLIKLCSLLKKKYNINPKSIIGHSDIAPLRKKDPGENFPWNSLKKNKIGLWYKVKKKKFKNLENKKIREIFFKNLFKIGYRYFSLHKKSKKDSLLIKAFQRKYSAQKVDGQIDQKTLKISHFLANKF